VQLDARPCELASLLAIGAISQQHEAKAKGQAIAVEVALPDIAITADATALADVLKRLLDNAVKFTPAGGQVGLEAHPGTVPGTAARRTQTQTLTVRTCSKFCNLAYIHYNRMRLI
jgi:signal transduction histidine kinase